MLLFSDVSLFMKCLSSAGLLQGSPGGSGPQTSSGKEKHNLQSVCSRMTSWLPTLEPSTFSQVLLIARFYYVDFIREIFNFFSHT